MLNSRYQSCNFALCLQIIVNYCLNAIQIVAGQYLFYWICQNIRLLQTEQCYVYHQNFVTPLLFKSDHLIDIWYNFPNIGIRIYQSEYPIYSFFRFIFCFSKCFNKQFVEYTSIVGNNRRSNTINNRESFIDKILGQLFRLFVGLISECTS